MTKIKILFLETNSVPSPEGHKLDSSENYSDFYALRHFLLSTQVYTTNRPK